MSIAVVSQASLQMGAGRTCYDEEIIAERLVRHAQGRSANLPDLCRLEPKTFVEKVILGNLSVDDGDWVQPMFRRTNGIWQLQSFEVLYRMSDASGVPFPAFVNFVKASTDQSSEEDADLRQAFRMHALSSLQRVDARLSQLGALQRMAMSSTGLLTHLNFTAKQLDVILSVPLENGKLLAAEETEYDMPPENLSAVRQEVWQVLGALSLDDVKPTLGEIMAFSDIPLKYKPPCTPGGTPYKPLSEAYTHDFSFARGFIADFQQARKANATAVGNLKFDEEYCCYFIGVGHAPFSRIAMKQWRDEHPVFSQVLRKAGVELIREALAAGMGVCLEVSFEDIDVQWLLFELPELEGRLCKQGGRSGPAALPHSLLEKELLAPVVGI